MPNRILCWDNAYIESSQNVDIIMHKPIKKNIALTLDNEWEGGYFGYQCVIKVGDKYRLYYRSSSEHHKAEGGTVGGRAVLCIAESYDGIHFKKPIVGKYEYNGTKRNNIVVNHHFDNFSVFYDENPNCPENERFKALCGGDFKDRKWWLYYYASRDGIDFEQKGVIDLKGTFDTYNVLFWDKETEQYFLYYRFFHQVGGEEFADMLKISEVTSVRDIRVATSKDFKTWTEHGRIKFQEGQPDIGLYTNQILKYYREPSYFLGFPTRYSDRVAVKDNFKFMPLGDKHEAFMKSWGRLGSVVTDCTIMFSRDGFNFNRSNEAFMTPGAESNGSWWYGSCYPAYGLVETEADEEGASPEISFYMGENRYAKCTMNMRRYAVRLDGFFSWYANGSGGELLTKPVTVDGETLKINFASSAIGGAQIALCDENGETVSGYESYPLFGDSTDRPVEFEKPLSDLIGQKVRLKVKLQDAHLYSFIFE